MSRIKPRLILWAGMAIIATATYYLLLNPLNPTACIGLTEPQITERLGTPTTKSPGNFGTPPVSLWRNRTHIETLTWKRLSGTLYISTSDESGRRICFTADWLPRGAVY